MKVLFCVSEAVPFAKTGGLADVAGALPAALRRGGLDVRVVMPLYRGIARDGLEPVLTVERPVGGRTIAGAVRRGTMPNGTPVYFVDAPELYDRPGLYGEGGRDYDDNLARFAFFCQAAVAVRRDAWTPDVVHCHDWQAALVAAYLRWERDPLPTMFTVHNLAYQGLFPAAQFELTGLPGAAFAMDGLEFYGQVNVMKAGLVWAHVLSTVSETYAREIQSPEYGMGLDGLLRVRAADLFGVLNGVDYSQWDPTVDVHLPARYGPDDLGGKARCKAALQREVGLPEHAYAPLVGAVARLVSQKGFDLVTAALEGIAAMGVQLVLLGTGDPSLEAAFRAAAARWPQQVAVTIGFDEGLAHRIEAGADMFLMPSRFEPSGLNQLYSLRYGTVPVVRRTGGLADSIVDVTPETLQRGTANGFVFDAYTPEALLATLGRAVAAYRDPGLWRFLQQVGMRADFSWDRAAGRYRDLYALTAERAARWR
ncbi:MAG: glycogen synthase GlgA [Armatimonadota bacterium]|nr:glycogen synthase GlgA [Armatimonadota bacterium]MDR7422051.1 glycogen synthase GlgA [Armatimonadota bacterium]MDR7457940.1 glycogen synthase GlgA [Armatimonadota bacterium]MDR7496029.1 glycogen synthase GlgA [Armatimonadota bacterium]MDR7512529.1 glycogen synthase GlgA [Armatimonadota bacterium]